MRKKTYDKGDYNKMMEHLNIDWETEFSTCSNDVNEQWKFFSNKLNNAIEECMPMKKEKIRGFKAKKHTIPLDKKSLSKIKRKQRL